MDARQRFIDTVRFKKVDHVSVALIGTPRFFAYSAGINLFECLHDPCKLIEAELLTFKKFPDITFIPGCWPDYGVGLFSAFGGRIAWYNNSMPGIKEFYIKSEEDIYSFEAPNPETDGLMPWYLETLKLFVKRREECGDNLHFVHSNGPGEIATNLWGMKDFLINIHLQPNLIKEFLKKITDTIIIWIKAQVNVLSDVKGLLLTDDISGLVSPEVYKEFLFPFHSRIREEFKNYICVFHCDTKSDHILEFLPQVGIDVFNLGPTTDLANAKNKIGDKVCLMGNIDPVNIMQNKKDVGLIKKAAEQCLNDAMGSGGYILSAGGGMNENTPDENVRALIDVAKLNGVYQ